VLPPPRLPTTMHLQGIKFGTLMLFVTPSRLLSDFVRHNRSWPQHSLHAAAPPSCLTHTHTLICHQV
jgi:hypothetical protein